jgi:hypothetical protein
MYVWNDKPHLFPEDFSFPDGSTLLAWQEWCCGNAMKGYPPLRQLTSSDLTSRKKKKQLSDFRFLMGTIEDEVKRLGQWVDHPTLDQANAMYALAHSILYHDAVSPKNRKRRPNDIKWTTMKNMVGKRRRKGHPPVSAGVPMAELL